MIETERLYIIPMTPKQLIYYGDGDKRLETELDCKYETGPQEEFFREILKLQGEEVEKDPTSAIWHTFWLMIDKTDRSVVGSIDFKNIPIDGVVEIGYGLEKPFEHKGYMTEAVAAFCKFAYETYKVTRVIAETEKDNFPSQRILIRCGFEKYKNGDTFWWQRYK